MKTDAEIGSWKVQGGCSQSLRREQDPAGAWIPEPWDNTFPLFKRPVRGSLSGSPRKLRRGLKNSKQTVLRGLPWPRCEQTECVSSKSRVVSRVHPCLGFCLQAQAPPCRRVVDKWRHQGPSEKGSVASAAWGPGS